MASSASRDQFLRQMEQIVEGIKQSRMKMEKKKQENKMRRDQLNDQYLELLEKQRLYFKTVKEFKEEGRKNEMLLSKMRAKASWTFPDIIAHHWCLPLNAMYQLWDGEMVLDTTAEM